MRQRDLRRLVEFLPTCYEMRSVESFAREVLSALPKFIGCNMAAYSAMDFTTNTSRNITTPSEYNTPRDDEIWMQVMPEHPGIAYLLKTGDTRAFRLSDFISRRELKRTALSNEHMRPRGDVDGTPIWIEKTPRSLIGFGISSERENTLREREIMRVLRPHLVAGYRNARAVEAATRRLEAVSDGLGHMDRAVVILSRDLRIQYATRRARQWIAEYFDGSQCLHERLPEDLDRWVRSQQTSLVDSSDLPPPRLPFAIRRGDKHLLIRLVSNPGELLLLMKERGAPLSVLSLAPLGLTARESEVLAHLASGKSDANIASALGTSTRTVQNHLRNLYEKMGVATRTAAAARAWETATSETSFEPAEAGFTITDYLRPIGSQKELAADKH